MAEDHGEDHGTMDMGEHLRTWRMFVSVIKWNMVGAAVLLAVLLIFRTHA